jgi:hypothetical protein
MAVRHKVPESRPSILSSSFAESEGAHTDWLTATGPEIEQHWVEQMQAKPDSRFYIFDMDDTLTETLLRWVQYFVRAKYGSQRYVEEFNRVMSAKSPFTFLREELGHEEFTKLEQKLRFSRWGNTYGKQVDPNLSEHLAQVLERKGEVLGVLTARPDSLQVREHTYQWLKRQELLHTLPQYHAPTAFTYLQTQQWKVDVLARMRRAVEQPPLMLVDDSVSTAANIEEWNKKHAEYLPLIQILLRTSLTDKAIAEKYDVVFSPEPSGVFVADNWSKIPEVADRAAEWYEDIRRTRTHYKRRNPPVR